MSRGDNLSTVTRKALKGFEQEHIEIQSPLSIPWATGPAIGPPGPTVGPLPLRIIDYDR